MTVRIQDDRAADGLAALRRAAATREHGRVAQLLARLGELYRVHVGDPEQALACFSRIERLARFTPWADGIIGGMATALVMDGRDERAIEFADRALEMSPSWSAPHRVRAAAFAHLGRMEDAASAIKSLLNLVPHETITAVRRRFGEADATGLRRYLDGLRLAGLQEGND